MGGVPMNTLIFFLLIVAAAALLFAQQGRRDRRVEALPVRHHRHWYRTRAPRRFD